MTNATVDVGVLRPVSEGVWVEAGPVRIVGMPLESTMTVLALADGGLVVCSPLPLVPARRAAVEALGTVRHLYAPNTFHHLWLGAWAAAFPAALVHAPAGLRQKRPDLRIDRVHGEALPAGFAGALDELRIEGFRLEESVLIHREARTLVVADLVHNIGRPAHPWTKLYAGAMGFYGRVALSRVIRWTAFSDRAAARRSIDAVLGRDFRHAVVGHGAPVLGEARDAIATAYGWLPPARDAGAALAPTRSSLRGAPCG